MSASSVAPAANSHLLALCDTCHNHYHLACLDPPLTRMPRKSKTAGWECWRCAAVSSRAQTPQPLPDTPRGTRRTRQAAVVSGQAAAAVNMQVSSRREGAWSSCRGSGVMVTGEAMRAAVKRGADMVSIECLIGPDWWR